MKRRPSTRAKSVVAVMSVSACLVVALPSVSVPGDLFGVIFILIFGREFLLVETVLSVGSRRS